METNLYSKDTEKHQRYLRAKKQTEMIKKFYQHLVVYLVANIIISVYKVREYMGDGDSFEEAFFQLDTFIVWIVWGVFVILQAIKTFKTNAILGVDWEEKKIREFMDENKR